jgi:murein DD-endopeptidase MepM/ murein hydrolase activator NlpD
MVTFVAGLVPAAAVVLAAAAVSPPLPMRGHPTPPPPLSSPAAPAGSQDSTLTRPATALSAALALPPDGIRRARSPGARTAPVAPRAGWRWPLSPRPAVTRDFRAPQSQWGAGHRGVDLAAAAGQPVLSASSGVVTHVGVVAGRPTVTVLHGGGVRTTYEPVGARVRKGEAVTAGQVLGVIDGHSHCGTCLHLGALRGRVYLDPLVLLGPRRVVLLPLDGDQAPVG